MDPPLGQGLRLERRAVREVVCRRTDERERRVRRSAPHDLAEEQGRHRVGGGARRGPHAHLPAAPRRGLPLRKRPQAHLRRREGGPRGDLHAARPRAADRHARLRPDRRDPHRRVWRVQRRGPERSHQRRQGKSGRHRGRRVPPRRDRSPQGRRRRRGQGHAERQGRRRLQADRPRRPDARRAGLLVERGHGRRPRGVPAGGPRQRAPALYVVHERDHGKAEGDPPHDGRIPRPDDPLDEVGLRLEGRGPLLVHGRHRLGHGAQLRRLRAALQRRDGPHVRRGPELARARPLLVDRRAAPREHPLHGPHGDPRIHQMGRPVAAQARPVEP